MGFMRIHLPLILVISSAQVVWAQPETTPANVVVPAAGPVPQRPQEPEKQIAFDLRALLRALNELNLENNPANWAVGRYIQGARFGFFGASEWAQYFVTARSGNRFHLDSIEIQKLEGDTASVKVTTTLLPVKAVARVNAGLPADENGTQFSTTSEVLTLKREEVKWNGAGPTWRVVPTASFKDAFRLGPFSLQNVAYFAGQRRDSLGQIRAMLSMQHLKWLALGVLQFAQDYDNRFLFQNETLHEAIFPYVKNEGIFLIPGTTTPYTFNNLLSDNDLAALQEPANIILFYEGQDQKPIFRYDGKAAIGFADGHVKLVTPDEADELRWKP